MAMTTITATLLSFLILQLATAQLSRGFYRIPYQTGTRVRVSRDASDHTPTVAIDMFGRLGSVYRIVAAASGYIRYIEDSYTGQSSGTCFNNYVWIEHPNGEWSKYSHLARNSVTVKAGRSVGDWVPIGSYLGDEDDVGCATGDHLHFEIGVPRKRNPITSIGGFLLDNAGAKRNRIPRICGIPGGIFVTGNEYIASWQPGNYVPGGAEVARHGLPIRFYQCQFDQMIDGGYEPVWLDMFNYAGNAYVNVVGRQRSGLGQWFHNLNGAQYQAKFNALKRAKFSPIQVDSYLLGRQVLYSGFFKKVRRGPRFAAYHGVSAATHQARFNRWTRRGFLPTSISVVSVGGQRQYTALYKKKSQGSILVRSQMLVTDYQQAFIDNLRAGRRVAYLNGYRHLGKAYLAVIFNSVTPSGRYRHGLTSSQYQTEYNSNRAAGRLTRIVTGYEDGGQRYAAGWR